MFLINDAKLISPDRVKGVNMCKGDTSLSFNPGKTKQPVVNQLLRVQLGADDKNTFEGRVDHPALEESGFA